MLGLRRKPRIETERMTLRLPIHQDYKLWSELREASTDHLTQWEPVRAADHLTRKAFTNRVYWAARAETSGTALPLFMLMMAAVLLTYVLPELALWLPSRMQG